MPTILLVKGFRFFFFSADGNEPVHIHVKKGDGDGKIWLQPDVRTAYMLDFTAQEERQIIDIVTEKRDLIILKWNEYFKSEMGL
ncbi:MAG: DUF4160 domain-containing protein [Bacteroidetes bacterium]|nr:DUF4160 domain-containing protein [Bacteroidota bacterium]MBS1541588.1 DUF4160 domain-containing protein [Bacteroidota bacterium]